MRKTFSIFAIILFLLSGFLTISSFNDFTTQGQEENTNLDVGRKSVDSSNLKDDIEDLKFYVEQENQTVSYDVTFATDEFNGSTVRSFIYSSDSENGGLILWNRSYLEESEAKVVNRHASNTASFSSIIDDSSLNIEAFPEGQVRMNLQYEKDGLLPTACIQPLDFHILQDDWGVTVNPSLVGLHPNADKTWAQLQFSFTAMEGIELENIYLRSNSTDLNQEIYVREDEYTLFPGTNSFTFRLLSNYHYYDLYLMFFFSSTKGEGYTRQIQLAYADNFVSGDSEKLWSTWSIIILILLLILVIITIIFIVLILFLIKKRKELEKQQDQAYYDENYEDGMR